MSSAIGSQTEICRDWLSGHCRLGDSCKDPHGEQELRSLSIERCPPRDFGVLRAPERPMCRPIPRRCNPRHSSNLCSSDGPRLLRGAPAQPDGVFTRDQIGLQQGALVNPETSWKDVDNTSLEPSMGRTNDHVDHRGPYSPWETLGRDKSNDGENRVDSGAPYRSAFSHVTRSPHVSSDRQSTAATAEFGLLDDVQDDETCAKIARGGSGGGPMGCSNVIERCYSPKSGVRSSGSPFADAVVGCNPVIGAASSSRGFSYFETHHTASSSSKISSSDESSSTDSSAADLAADWGSIDYDISLFEDSLNSFDAIPKAPKATRCRWSTAQRYLEEDRKGARIKESLANIPDFDNILSPEFARPPVRAQELVLNGSPRSAERCHLPGFIRSGRRPGTESASMDTQPGADESTITSLDNEWQSTQYSASFPQGGVFQSIANHSTTPPASTFAQGLDPSSVGIATGTPL